MTQKNVGTIVQAIGPVLDIRFPNDALLRLPQETEPPPLLLLYAVKMLITKTS